MLQEVVEIPDIRQRVSLLARFSIRRAVRNEPSMTSRRGVDLAGRGELLRGVADAVPTKSIALLPARHTVHWVVLIILCAFSTNEAVAQRNLGDDYDTQLETLRTVEGLGSDLFGDSTDLYTGATEFTVPVVSIPGNNNLPVGVSFTVNTSDNGSWPIFSLGIETAYLSGIFRHGDKWPMGSSANPELRCSHPNGPPEPPEVDQSAGKPERFFSNDYWHGNYMHVPGVDTQLMMPVSSSDTNQPTDGATYKWVTKDAGTFPACQRWSMT